MMMVFVGISRHYVTQLIKSEPEITGEKLEEMRRKNIQARSQRLRMNCGFINEEAWLARRQDLCRKKTGTLRENCPAPANPMMSNPMAMVDMLKGNVTFMVPNMIMMTFCSYFFAGFVCVKFPFAMPSNRFKLMLQRGIDLKSLDVSYVSSLSWYLLVTFGLRGVYQLLLGQDVDSDEQRMMQMQMGMPGMGGGMGGGFDANTAFKRERELLSIIKHKSASDQAERQLLGDRYPSSDSTAFEAVDLSKFGVASVSSSNGIKQPDID
jgi:hypothetical protein